MVGDLLQRNITAGTLDCKFCSNPLKGLHRRETPVVSSTFSVLVDSAPSPTAWGFFSSAAYHQGIALTTVSR
jgi:hypothetical protein